MFFVDIAKKKTRNVHGYYIGVLKGFSYVLYNPQNSTTTVRIHTPPYARRRYLLVFHCQTIFRTRSIDNNEHRSTRRS